MSFPPHKTHCLSCDSVFIQRTCMCVHVWAQQLQQCLPLCKPMDCSLPGSSVHGHLQARTLEWAAMPSSRGSSRPTGPTQVLWQCRRILYPLNYQGSHRRLGESFKADFRREITLRGFQDSLGALRTLFNVKPFLAWMERCS